MMTISSPCETRTPTTTTFLSVEDFLDDAHDRHSKDGFTDIDEANDTSFPLSITISCWLENAVVYLCLIVMFLIAVGLMIFNFRVFAFLVGVYGVGYLLTTGLKDLIKDAIKEANREENDWRR